MIERTLIEDRVDWITATRMFAKVEEDNGNQKIESTVDRLLHAESKKGDNIRHQNMLGFRGLMSGGFFAGVSGKGWMFRASGDCAADNWRELYGLSTNVTRLDCAFTLREDGAWRDWSFVHLQEIRDYAKQHAPHLRVRRIDGGKHGNSLMIGSRRSDAYARIYDKGAESGLEFYRDCWRYEVEFKRSMAEHIASELDDDSDCSTSPAAIGSYWFRRRLCSDVPVLTAGGGRARSLAPSSDDKRLDWIKRGVARSIVGLIERQGIRPVLDALGLDRDTLRSAGYAFESQPKPQEENQLWLYRTQRLSSPE